MTALSEKLWTSPELEAFPHPLLDYEEAREIERVLPLILPSEQRPSYQGFSDWLSSLLPFVTMKPSSQPCRHTFYLLCLASQELKQEEYFNEMIKHHLIPGQDVTISSFRYFRFYLKGLPSKLLFLAEATVIIQDKRSLENLHQHFVQFSQTLSLGCISKKSTPYSLANHNLSSQNQKLFRVEAELRKALKRFPRFFGEDLLKEWGAFLSLSSPSFWEMRSSRLLSRLVISQYAMRKKIKKALLIKPEGRHLSFHLLPSLLQSPFGTQAVLGLLVTISLTKHEYFDEEHLLLAIQKGHPHIHLVKGSKYLHRPSQDHSLMTLYIELDKENGELFTLNEKKSLKKILSCELKERVQKLMPSLFIVRNEEQIMKNIIALSRELDGTPSLPQMNLSFEKQTESSLIFTMILLYVEKQKELALEEKLYALHPLMEVSLERKERVGYLNKKIPKEAAVFRIQVAKTPDLLRKDLSVNVYRGRQKVYTAICKALGEVRDYNGGLILKQQELLAQLQGAFPELNQEKGELLENFFYGITPIEKQATLSLSTLSKLLSFLSESLDQPLSSHEPYVLSQKEENDYLFVCLKAEDSRLKKLLQKKILSSSSFVTSTFFFHEEALMCGFILDSADKRLQQNWMIALLNTIEEWQLEKKEHQFLRLSYEKAPNSLDPRLAGCFESKEILLLLHEGLLEMTPEGKITYAVAQSVDISEDKKTYTFHLRDCKWSNGAKVKASDFEHAWKTILSPEFSTPFAQYFYAIKNARAIKQRKASLQEIGIKALNDHTLRVELEHPQPYFLELLGHPLFAPINAQMDKTYPRWSQEERDSFVCNGSFCLKKNHPDKEYVLEKNPHYWNASNVILNQVTYTKRDKRNAFDAFKHGELDWLGSPFRPWESLFELAKTEKTESVLLHHCTHWCALHVHSFPLENVKLRKALSLALNRQEFTEGLHDVKPAFSPLTPPHSQHIPPENGQGEPLLAQQLFEEALYELYLTKKTFPRLLMLYPEGDKREKICRQIQRQWKKVLGVDLLLQGYPWSVLFEKVIKGQFQMACVSWYSAISDPLHSLSIFQSIENDFNVSRWEQVGYSELLQLAHFENDRTKRLHYCAQAESLLIEDLPVIPLLHEKTQGIKKPSLKVEAKYGAADFRKAFFLEKKI